MSFDEVRFPEDIAFGMQGGAEYSTDIIELFSGYEQRNSNWAQPRMRYTTTHPVKTQAQMNTLIAFFRARKGKANGFRFRDWSDYTAIAQSIGTGNNTNHAFQLQKSYVSGSTTSIRTTKKIVASGSQITTVPKIYLNSVLKTETTDYTLDYTTGIVTFVTAPGTGVAITADFEFDVPVRFDTDTMTIRQEYGQEFYWENIALIEVRV